MALPSIPVPLTVKTPEQLFELIEELKVLLQRGELIFEIGSCTLADIQQGHPWPDDVIELFFKDRTGQRYRLWCETYHGLGGRWELVTNCDQLK